ncbi:unnamed protein product [Lota lota]
MTQSPRTGEENTGVAWPLTLGITRISGLGEVADPEGGYLPRWAPRLQDCSAAAAEGNLTGSSSEGPVRTAHGLGRRRRPPSPRPCKRDGAAPRSRPPRPAPPRPAPPHPAPPLGRRRRSSTVAPSLMSYI